MAVTHTITGGLVQLSGNPIEIVLTADTPRDNHRLAVKVKCNQLISNEQIEEQEPVNLVSKINIQGLVDEPLPIDFHFPVVGVATGHGALVLNVSLEIGEIYDDANGDRQESWTVVNDALRIIDGKLREHELRILNELGKSFASEYINGGKFLTAMANPQTVAPNQIVKLWYLSRWTGDHPATIFTQVNVSSKVAHLPIQQAIVLYANTGLLELSLNPVVLQGFELEPGETVTSFEVWIEDAEGEISEHRIFKVDNNYYENQLFAFYRNRFSAVDAIWLKGRREEGLKTEVETAYRPSDIGASTKQASIKTVTANGQRYWDINTGVMTRAEAISLRDFLESKERWIIDPDNAAKVIPVYVDGGEFALYDSSPDKHNLQNVRIKLQEAHV